MNEKDECENCLKLKMESKKTHDLLSHAYSDMWGFYNWKYKVINLVENQSYEELTSFIKKYGRG